MTDTEKLVNRLLDYFNDTEGPQDVGEWPVDAHFNIDLKKNLSYSKMINVINHTAPRNFNEDGIIQQIPMSIKTGRHSSSKDARVGELD